MLGGEGLGDVLATADGVDVQGLGHAVVEGDAVDLGGDAAHPGALAQDEGIAVVTIGAQDVRQDEADVQGGVVHLSFSFGAAFEEAFCSSRARFLRRSRKAV